MPQLMMAISVLIPVAVVIVWSKVGAAVDEVTTLMFTVAFPSPSAFVAVIVYSVED